MALRLAHMALTDIKAERDPGRKRHYLDVVDLERRCWNGQAALVPEALEDPLHWRKPRTVFVVSMGDLFHDAVPFSYIRSVWNVMETARDHTFLVLTKRPERMHEFLTAPNGWFAVRGYMAELPNVWLGTTIENPEYSYRAEYLRHCPAAAKFLSLEPLLGSFADYPGTIDDMDWVIAGGETGPGRREMQVGWARDIRDQCQAAGVPFFFKRTGNGATPDDLKIREWPEAH
jgi:protein gp37